MGTSGTLLVLVLPRSSLASAIMAVLNYQSDTANLLNIKSTRKRKVGTGKMLYMVGTGKCYTATKNSNTCL